MQYLEEVFTWSWILNGNLMTLFYFYFWLLLIADIMSAINLPQAVELDLADIELLGITFPMENL